MKRDLNWLKAKADIRIGCFDMVSMGYAIEMYNEDQVHIEKLEKEIASLKEQLSREMAAVDFYADRENWSYVNQYNKTLMKMNEDIEWVSPGVFLDKFAGNIARSTQARRKR